ncbi:MAG TPA: carbohydrate-binding protein, partial [Kribbellaceae bacterium]|nr:carbohydrate-binding protein [Kribbellaceae bacterium]
NFWDDNNAVPVTITLDLGSVKKVAYLAINQREWSPTHNRTTFGRAEDSARIRNYTLQTSNDGSSFSTVRTADLPSTRGVAFLDFNANTRFIRLRVNSTWASSDVPNFFHKLRIDEMFVGSDFAGSGGVTPGHFEAENATLSAGSTIDTNHTGFSGTGFVNTPNAAGAFVEWSGVSATAGTRTLTFRFSNGSTAARPCELVVNGGAPITLNFGTTANWDTWTTVSATVPLNATNNTIRLTATTAAGAANLDWLEVS